MNCENGETPRNCGPRLALEGGTPVRPKDDFLIYGQPLIEEPEIEEVECQECHTKGQVRRDAKEWTCPKCKERWTVAVS